MENFATEIPRGKREHKTNKTHRPESHTQKTENVLDEKILRGEYNMSKIEGLKWKCRLGNCNKQYKTARTIKSHLYSEHPTKMPPEPQKEQQCTYCNKQYSNITELLGHINVNNKQRKRNSKPNLDGETTWGHFLWYTKTKTKRKRQRKMKKKKKKKQKQEA